MLELRWKEPLWGEDLMSENSVKLGNGNYAVLQYREGTVETLFDSATECTYEVDSFVDDWQDVKIED